MRRFTVLLGPQRHQPCLRQAVEDVDRRVRSKGKLAVVTAGWEEREMEIQELDEHVGGRSRNLEVWGRVEDVFRHDPELLEGMRQRHDALRELQALYRLRLGHALEAARELQERPGSTRWLEAERKGAIDAVRALDAEHLRRLDELHAHYDGELSTASRPVVRHHKQQIGAILDGCSILCIAGGHVGALLHRLRLFDVLGLWGDRPVIGWSGGAMVLGPELVVFHDSPPQGAGNAEVYARGLMRFDGVLPLPHASKRLRLDDRQRVSLLARRFAELRPLTLDACARVDVDGDEVTPRTAVRRLQADGSVPEEAAA